MSFADPQSVTFAAPLPVGAVSLPRISVGANTSTYQSNDGYVKLSASSAIGKRARRVLRLDHSKLAPTQFDTMKNGLYSMSCYLVFDVPLSGYSTAEQLEVYRGLKGQMTASTDALISKLIGGEN
jgi:hypothetical protein